MTAITGVSMPKFGITKQDLTTPKNLTLMGVGATGLVAGGVIGALKNNPIAGVAIGGAVAAAAIGMMLLGNASSSQRDGYCDYNGDPDCDYPGVVHHPHTPRFDNPWWDGGYRDDDFDGAREDYPDTGHYPQGGTATGDEW